MDKNKEFERLVKTFMDSFQLVFDWDWDFTKSVMEDDNISYFIDKNGTFLEPNVDDESNNWANRGGLLSDYRNLSNFIKNYLPDPDSPTRDEDHNGEGVDW